MSPLEAVWAEREEKVYRRLFGDLGPGIYPVGADSFRALGHDGPDPRWLHTGVFACPPHEGRTSWLYASSGLSNPWEDEPANYSNNEWSGLGVEFVMETDRRADWPIVVLHRMIAFELLLASGKFGDKPLLEPGDRIPLRASVSLSEPSELQTLVLSRPDHIAAGFALASGRVEFLHFIAISDTEVVFAKANGSDSLIERLKAAGVYPLTVPERTTVPL